MSTIRVSSNGSPEERLRRLEQCANYEEEVFCASVMESGAGPAGPPGPTGPPGPQGPAGDPGTGAYRHVQASAATVWTITHNLSFRPNVTAVDSTGRAIWPGALDYTSAVTVQLTFSAAVGGEAYLS